MDVILLYKLIWFGTVPGKCRRYLHNTRISLFLYCPFADQVIELPNLYSEAEATTLFASTFSTIQFLRIVLYFPTCAVGTFDVAQAKWKSHPHSLSGLDYVPKNSTFLVEIDGDLHLFKLDRPNRQWFQIDNLSNRSVFIDGTDNAFCNVSTISPELS
ncbi:hypothetical protein WN944_007480 [Citrus x changshan-huyou]|uniref:Uncharacterized protein n=1 Tax=Citrus x changshan-huyou TaxID=2935761 RepID=A0AAP0QUF1_9ROSI